MNRRSTGKLSFALSVMIFLFFMISCSDSVKSDGMITVSADRSSLEIINNSGSTIFYFAHGDKDIPLILWTTSLEKSVSITNGSSKTIPADQAYTDRDANVHVFWWNAVYEDGEWVAGPVTSIIEPIRD